MTSDAHPNELGAFLKARRAELSPRTVGLPDTVGPRHVAGLRREDVALLAAISVDHYTRIEQGRSQPSASVLAALGQVLHLGDDQRDHLFALAGRRRPRHRRPDRNVRPQMRRLLDGLGTAPAIVIGRSLDVLAWNPLAGALFTDFAKLPAAKRNYARVLFTDPAMRTLYTDWRTAGRECVSHLRMLAAQYPQDSRLAGLIGELSLRDKDFGRWWGSRQMAPRCTGTKRFRHPVAGDLVLDQETFTCGTDLDQKLAVWTAEPGTPSYDALRVLVGQS